MRLDESIHAWRARRWGSASEPRAARRDFYSK